MQLELKAWYAVSNVRVTSERLVARLLPDYFFHEAEPVLTLTVDHPSDAAAALRLLERFREEECVVEITVASGVVELWAEYDEEPTRLVGEEAHHAWSPYSTEEALAIAGLLEKQLSDARSENAALRAKKRELEEFIKELLRRAEAKRSLTAKSTAAADGQIDALERVLNRLTGA